MRGRNIFNAFLIIVASTIFFLLPYTLAAYDLQTDQHSEDFSVVTAVGQTTDNITFHYDLYDDDTGTINVVSDLSSDTISWSSYNATDNHLLITGMTANATRILTATYDKDALNSSAITSFVNVVVWIWLLAAAAFAPAALAAIFTGRG